MLIKSLIKYLFSSQNEHGIHSPFVYDLYTQIIKKDDKIADFTPIDHVRDAMRRSNEIIQITDFGAGSKVNNSNLRKIRDIAKNSEKPPKLGRLFFRLIQYFDSKTIFDLGTSLGLTTLYLATANKNAKVITFEGCPETAKVAKKNFDDLKLHHIEIVLGNIDQTLHQKVQEHALIDFAFFDANHRYEPTIQYFEACLTKANEKSIFIFDDIHWSSEMETAWEVIKAHPSATVTIDLLWVGLVFFRKQQRKQHFVLKFPLL